MYLIQYQQVLFTVLVSMLYFIDNDSEHWHVKLSLYSVVEQVAETILTAMISTSCHCG